jgi:cytochrome c peroxidase|tara:strand:- start:20 stop:955 length:936 start_codon:yes stop_codon:yes gene_type:complete
MKILTLVVFGAGIIYGATAFAGSIPTAANDVDFHQFPAELVKLGRDLFFDPILSGNKNIACATCHHPSLGTSDGMSLSVGEDGVGLGESRRVDMGNALSAFIGSKFRATESPFDRYLAGEDAVSEEQLAGMDLFYGKTRCSTCHSGTFQTDHNFHAIGLLQLGPGKDDYASDAERGMITSEQEDMYRFRTPTLRNVSMTGPYGHNGAYANLEDIVRHHLDAVKGLSSYDRSKAVLADDVAANDWKAMDDFDEVMRIAEAIEISDVALVEDEIAKIISFLGALTDEGAGKRGLGTPNSVPSGLPLDATAPPS